MTDVTDQSSHEHQPNHMSWMCIIKMYKGDVSMTRTVIMYKDNRNNALLRFPSPSERVEKSLVFRDEGKEKILHLSRSGSISITRQSNGTYLVLDTDDGTKKFRLSSSCDLYDKIKEFTPMSVPKYNTDKVYLYDNIFVRFMINPGVTITFDTED